MNRALKDFTAQCKLYSEPYLRQNRDKEMDDRKTDKERVGELEREGRKKLGQKGRQRKRNG